MGYQCCYYKAFGSCITRVRVVSASQYVGLRIASLLAGDVVRLASSDGDLRRALGRSAAECEAAGNEGQRPWHSAEKWRVSPSRSWE